MVTPDVATISPIVSAAQLDKSCGADPNLLEVLIDPAEALQYE